MTDGKSAPRVHRALAWASLFIVAAAAVLGWAASFVGLHDYGQIRLHGFTNFTAWFVPGAIDGAAFATSLMTYRASIKGRAAVHGRLLMWGFTAASSWINWIHQTDPEARIVAAGLPVAAVAVFDVVLKELRHDYEERSGQKAFRLRLGLLALRWVVDRSGTSSAFRGQITAIPVESLAGLGLEHVAATSEPVTAASGHVTDMSVTPELTVTATPGHVRDVSATAVADDTEREMARPDSEQPSTVAIENADVATSEQVNALNTATPVTVETAIETVTAPVVNFEEHAARTDILPKINEDVAMAELSACGSDAERIRYAANKLGHTKPSGVVTWLNGYGYPIKPDTARVTLQRYRKKLSHGSVVRLDGRGNRAMG